MTHTKPEESKKKIKSIIQKAKFKRRIKIITKFNPQTQIKPGGDEKLVRKNYKMLLVKRRTWKSHFPLINWVAYDNCHFTLSKFSSFSPRFSLSATQFVTYFSHFHQFNNLSSFSLHISHFIFLSIIQLLTIDMKNANEWGKVFNFHKK